MSRRVDAVSDDRSETARHRNPGRLPLLQLGGSAQHFGLWRRHAVRHRFELRRAARAEPADARMDHAARALSARFLLTRYGRAHRRSECRLEGSRTVRELRNPFRLAHRGRKGYERQDRQIPGAPGSARALGALKISYLPRLTSVAPFLLLIRALRVLRAL